MAARFKTHGHAANGRHVHNICNDVDDSRQLPDLLHENCSDVADARQQLEAVVEPLHEEASEGGWTEGYSSKDSPTEREENAPLKVPTYF